MFESISFIGAGRIARIILGGWKNAKSLPCNISVYDISPAAVATLQADFPAVRSASLEES